MKDLPAHLNRLTSTPNWVVWRYVTTANGKQTKVPYQLNGLKAASDDPSTWATYAEIVVRSNEYDGVGFVLTKTEFAAFDIDDCRDPSTGSVEPWAENLVRRAASYAEVSPSGTGLRIIGSASGPAIHRKLPVPSANGVTCEIYRGATRYITVTGNIFNDAPLAPLDQVMDEVLAELDHRSEKNRGERRKHGTKESLPLDLATMLFATGAGGYASRSELLFAFLTRALRWGARDETIIDACLIPRSGCGIYEHCRQNGGRKYVERQLAKAREKAGSPFPERLTDLGNAQRLVRLYGDDIRFVPEWGKWLVWRDAHWRLDKDGEIQRLAKATTEAMFEEAGRINEGDRQTELRKHALKSQSAQRLKSMIDLAQSEAAIVLPVEKIDADPLLLGVQNGVIDLRTCTFRETRRVDYVTKIAGASYDLDATCPNWMKFLSTVASEAVAKYIQRVMGYMLTGLTGEEVMFVLYGTGNNGKSTFRETLFALLEDYAVGADASLLVTSRRAGGATPDLARLHGRRLVTVNETEQNALLNESRVKFITGHDVITARNLYEQPFDFTPTHKTVLTTNYKPIVRGNDEGLWRRLHLIPFLREISANGRDVNFREKKLLPELPGILNFALEGLRAYQAEALNPPPEVTDATKDYRDDMDIIGAWLEERCVRNPDWEESTATLHKDYSAWASAEVGFSISPTALGRELAARGFAKVRVRRQTHHPRGFRGLQLLM